MKYILRENEFSEIEETAGTLVNIADVPVEVSVEPTHNTGIILFPKQHFAFKEDSTLYVARKMGAIGTAVVAAITAGFTFDDIASVEDIRAIIDGYYPDRDTDDDIATDQDIQDVIDDYFGDIDYDDIASDQDIQDIIDDYYD